MHPASVAVIDDGFDSNTLAAVVVRSLQTGGFKGKIYAVGPREENLPGILNCSDVEELPEAPELAVFAFWPRSAIPLLVLVVS